MVNVTPNLSSAGSAWLRCLRRVVFAVLLGSVLGPGVATAADATVTGAGPVVLGITGKIQGSYQPNEFALGEVVTVKVHGLSEWMRTNPDALAKLIPVVQGRGLVDCHPLGRGPSGEEEISFVMKLTPKNRDAWVDVIGPISGRTKEVKFSVGLEGGPPFQTEVTAATLVVILWRYGIVAGVLIVGLVVALLWFARNTSILRDGGSTIVTGLRPYNLGRTQMAFWFFLTFSAFIVIWLITDALDTITPSLLTLLGISAGTALGEVLIDAEKDKNAMKRLRDATTEKPALEQSITEQQAQLDALKAKGNPSTEEIALRDRLVGQLLDRRTRLNGLNQDVEALAEAVKEASSHGFFRDIVSDGQGYSLHRLQIVAWTLVLGAVFVSDVYNYIAMPEFNSTLLGLMGLSSGTYIGLKFPERP